MLSFIIQNNFLLFIPFTSRCQQTVPLSKLTFPQWPLYLVPIVELRWISHWSTIVEAKFLTKEKQIAFFFFKKSCLVSLFCFVFKYWNGIILQHNLYREIQIDPKTNCVSEMWLGHSRQPDVMSLTCKQQQCHHGFLRISSRESYGGVQPTVLTPPYLVE